MNDIRRVGVVGCGAMGAGIAALCATAGLDVQVAVPSRRAMNTRRRRVDDALDRMVRKGTISSGERDDAGTRVALTAELDDLADRQLVIEAVPEEEHTKLQLFRMLDKIIENQNAIMATNTSSLPVTKLAKATGRPEYVVGMHFFNPATSLPLVELVGTILTAKHVSEQSERFLSDKLGKEVIHVPDRGGFIVNALLVPYLLAAIRMHEARIAPPEDIDRAMTMGCAHPIGPLALADMIGLDVLADISRSLQREFNDPTYGLPPILSRMVEAGFLGKKSGKGFHAYQEKS